MDHEPPAEPDYEPPAAEDVRADEPLATASMAFVAS
jgi:hypothetical protein